jgi:hypothetical protein
MILNPDGKWPAPETQPQEAEPIRDLGAFIDELLENRAELIARREYDNAKVKQGDIDRGNDNARMEFLDGWLYAQLAELKEEALSPATEQTYSNDTRAFIRYIVDLSDDETAYPCRDVQLAMYLIHKLMDGAATGTLQRICSALTWANSLKGAADPVQIYSRAVLRLAQQGGIEALRKDTLVNSDSIGDADNAQHEGTEVPEDEHVTGE